MRVKGQKPQTHPSRCRLAERNDYFWVEGFKLFRKADETLFFWDRQRRREIPLTKQELDQVFESN